MRSHISDYPLSVFWDALQSDLLAIFGLLAGLYLGECCAHFTTWTLPEAFWLLMLPVFGPLAWVWHTTAAWPALLVALLVLLTALYIFVPRHRFELVLSIGLVVMYLEVCVWGVLERDRLYAPDAPMIFARMIGVTALIVAAVAWSLWARWSRSRPDDDDANDETPEEFDSGD